MGIKNINGLITNKLACIDIATRQEGKYRVTRWTHELMGIQQCLYQMGFNLEMSVNPYYHEDGKPSTFKITVLD